MSKAFTRESDGASELPPIRRPASPLPPGARNYLTPHGERRLRQELERLVQIERPQLTASIHEEDVRRQVQLLDQRILQIQESLRSAVIVPPSAEPHDTVRFGATVTVRGRGGTESRYRIVGVDETDIDQGCVSWLSPIATALLNARVGERVRFRFPSGEEELEIVGVEYGAETGSQPGP